MGKVAMYRKNKIVFSFLFAIILFIGCATQDAGKRIAAFSEATNLTTQNIANAFDMVERSYYEVQVLRSVVNYDVRGFQPNSIQPFLEPEELEARLRVLKGLQQYSEKLALIMGNSQLSAFDKQTKNFGESLATINRDLVKKLLSKTSADDNQIQIFTTAINALGRWFIEYKRQKGVKEVIQSMHGTICEICDLLIKDIGVSPAEKDVPATGLRAQLWNQYDLSAELQDKFIQQNICSLDPISKRNEIKQLATLVSEQMKADATLKSMRDAISKLKETHGKLNEAFSKETIEIDNLITQLISEGERIKNFYESLAKT